MNRNAQQSGTGSFTGQRFSRKPRKSVLFTDTLARRLITASGIGSIIAVSLVGLFLVWVVLPLFTPTGLEEVSESVQSTGAASADSAVPSMVHQAMDDYGSLVWSLHADGTILVHEVDGGKLLARRIVRPGVSVTAVKASGHQGRVLLGYADGTMQTVKVGFDVSYHNDSDLPDTFASLSVGERASHEQGLVERTPEHQLRLSRLTIQADEPVSLGTDPIVLIDGSETSGGLVVAALDAAGVLFDRQLRWRKNLLTGELRVRSTGSDLRLEDLRASRGTPVALVLNDAGDRLLLAEIDGTTSVLRRDGEGEYAAVAAVDLVPDPNAKLTALAFIAGRVSLAVGDDQGGLSVWFPVRETPTSQPRLQRVHELDEHHGVVTALASSGRSRLLLAGYRDGKIRLYHVTSHRFLGEADLEQGPIVAAAISPREDLILAANRERNALFHLDAPHPDISFSALLRPVWYEGYPGPVYAWQSSAATDTFEPKLSLVPLIYGTLKATFYSMLFGLPLALLAALYTSEFLHRRTRSRIKPVIETMASLPSVVLGFLAALVMAPFVERVLVQVLAVLFCAPFFLLLGAHLWQMLPRRSLTRLEPWRPLAVLIALVAGMWCSWQWAGPLEQIGFAGDVKLWLDGQIGSGITGWFVLLLAPAALLVGWWNTIQGEVLIRGRGPGWIRWQLGMLDLGRFLASTAATIVLALFAAWMLSSSGWDPRGSMMDTYVQRNALVVGFAMGFAVIPIIYSIAEDALSAVPDHLRAASLGAGATPWQTAFKVVVPPAMSGLFSAGMIGLGRAVGETMIVLMAAGNTPIMEMNIFNGFRTLSANLAVELPEAVQNSTHYRTLFLAALTLFIMTFLLNTIAEVVRQHFRRKSSQL